jgi:serine phosphatase RsbU (regulator of sigma subunit)
VKSFNLLRLCHLSFFFNYVRITVAICAISLSQSHVFGQIKTLNAKEGIVDARSFVLDSQIVTLDGAWEFCWQRFISSAEFEALPQQNFQKVPSRWRGLLWQGRELGADGYASYRLRILLPTHRYKRLGLRIPRVNTAFSLFVDDKLIASTGKIGDEKRKVIPQYLSEVYEFEVEKDTVAVVFHVANFHYHSGGLWESIELSTIKNLQRKREKLLFFDLLLIGSILMTGFYHLGIYVQRIDDKSNLYFFILCFAVVLRILSSGERLLIYFNPDFNWELLIKMEFVSAMVGLISLSYFFRCLFPVDYSKWVLRTILGVEIALILIFILLPARFSSYIIIYHNYLSFAILLINLTVVVLAVIRQRDGADILAWGFSIGAIFVANDILHNIKIVNTGNTAPIGLLIFFFSQALLLSNRSSKAFKRVIKLSDALETTNENLEAKIKERTAEIKESNEELNQTVEELNTTLELAKNQKLEIEVQNKNMTSSINYAKRIQDAILPAEQQIKTALPESFILYLPKDIVSGDFYWFTEKEDKKVVIMADCTGHGIPGAFMSLLGASVIHQLVNLQDIISPELILGELNNEIRKILKQDTNRLQEGMDVAVCIIDEKNKTLEYAGAHRPLYYIQGTQFKEIKGDRLYVGGGDDNKIFTKHTLPIHPPITIYMFSDGYQDQYGEVSGKKFGTKLFKEILLEIHQQPAAIQLQTLHEKFELWKGKEKQIDDVLVIGIML